MNKQEILESLKDNTDRQTRFIYKLMDITGCRKNLGLGWIARLIKASEQEVIEVYEQGN